MASRNKDPRPYALWALSTVSIRAHVLFDSDCDSACGASHLGICEAPMELPGPPALACRICDEHWRACFAPFSLIKGRGRKRQSHCKRGHEYTADNVWMLNGTRRCKVCRKAAMARSNERRRDESAISIPVA